MARYTAVSTAFRPEERKKEEGGGGRRREEGRNQRRPVRLEITEL
jgi:hypothetical protein